jgi:hypothetical protein
VEAVNLLVRSLEETRDGLPSLPPMSAGDNLPLITGAVHSTDMASNDPDESTAYLVQALQELQRKDPSRYVRLQSSVALRQISDRQSH